MNKLYDFFKKKTSKSDLPTVEYEYDIDNIRRLKNPPNPPPDTSKWKKASYLEERELKKKAKAVVQKVERTSKNSSKNAFLAWKSAIRKGLIEEIGMCEKCHRKHVTLTLDHIIPVAMLTAMGIDPDLVENEIGNLRLLCSLCNSKKGHILDFTDPRTKPLLAHYLSLVPNGESFGSGHPYNEKAVSFKDWWEKNLAQRLKQVKKAGGHQVIPD